MKQKSPESSVDVESGGFFMPLDFAYAVSYGGFLGMNFWHLHDLQIVAVAKHVLL